jgi:hypothetical protein
MTSRPGMQDATRKARERGSGLLGCGKLNGVRVEMETTIWQNN